MFGGHKEICNFLFFLTLTTESDTVLIVQKPQLEVLRLLEEMPKEEVNPPIKSFCFTEDRA